MNNRLTVIKLGGALLTGKKRPFTFRQEIINQAAAEIKSGLDAGLIDQLLLVHGVGSFGHPPVVQYQLHKGFKSQEQLIHLTYAQNCVMKLRLAIAEAHHEVGVPVSTIFPSSCMTATGAGLKASFLDAAAGFLGLGMVPLMGGDMLVDDQMGFCVYGGDKIAIDLALHFGASRLIFATDVNGIYDRDPKQFQDAQPIDQYTLGSARISNTQLGSNLQVDVSGAMAGKLTAVRTASEAMTNGLQVHIISMLEENNLTKLLKGKQTIGTTVLP